ncbi:GNAT family N-acetyltransferase [Listeria costaricensis]|uniref:GNAT family N-acetyltransferase n=1 Tax=Listeria costaricensis TaxID=2026604 RepID=UPI000C084D64|nr:N-acetyltransferase [Listeria costaricensis]
MRIRKQQTEENLLIRAILTEAFGREDEADLVEQIRATAYYLPALSLVAELRDQTLSGYLLFSEIELKTADETRLILGLAPLAVRPAHQRNGIGSALVEEGLRLAKQKAYPAVAVLGHADYYPRFGFRPSTDFGIPAPFAVPEENYLLLELYPDSLKNLAGTIQYPEAFSK